MYQGGRCKFYNPKYSHCLPWLSDQFLVIHSFITETTVQCEKPLNNEVFCHRLPWISWVGLHNMESSGCFKYKKFPTPRSSVLSLAVFIFEVCPSKPYSEEQNKDDGIEWLFLFFSHPFFLFIITFKFKFTGLLGPWMWKKYPSVLVSREGWWEVDLYLSGMKSSSRLSPLSPLANREWNSKTILRTAKRVSESSQRQQPFPQEKEETAVGQIWKVCSRSCILTFPAASAGKICIRGCSGRGGSQCCWCSRGYSWSLSSFKCDQSSTSPYKVLRLCKVPIA